MAAQDNPDHGEPLSKFCAAFFIERDIESGKTSDHILPLKDESGFPLPPTHPYPGLRSFTPREARLFFGRRKEAEELRERLAESNVVIVLGGSGSGKSSLVLAGVLPRLNDVGRIPGRTGRWYTATFRPGDSPCEKIVEALWNDVCQPLLALKKGPQAFAEICFENPTIGEIDDLEIRKRFDKILKPEGTFTLDGLNAFLAALEAIDERLATLRGSFRSGRINFLLLADQFEELFRDVVIKEKKKDIDTVVDLFEFARRNPKGPLVVVATLRSEELHRCAEIDGLAPIVNDGFYLIDHPKLDALIEATVNPGRQTLLDWDVTVSHDERADAAIIRSDGNQHAPFSAAFIRKLQYWVEAFQSEERTEGVEGDRRRRHQADLLPLFQHLLRVTWGTAVGRWERERADTPSIEPSDIENWIRRRRQRVGELRSSLRAISAPLRVPDLQHDSHNVLEACFDTGFAIALSEAITGKPWDELEQWPMLDESMKERLRLLQAAFVSLATRDDKGNDARSPASMKEIFAASNGPPDPETLESALSFFKARSYLRGGENGERYDVNHEALIRNSTEYQTWLIDAKRLADVFYEANAALLAGGANGKWEWEPSGKAGWLDWILYPALKFYRKFALRRFYEAAQRFSSDKCRDLERIFGANAVFKPSWIAERAELPGTRDEQTRAAENIRAAWEAAKRWHIDFSAGQEEKPSLMQRTAASLNKLWSSIVWRAKRGFVKRGFGRAPDRTDMPLSGRSLFYFKLRLSLTVFGFALVLAALAFPLAFATIQLTANQHLLTENQDALRALAVIAEVTSPRDGPGNDSAQKQILKSGQRIEKLRQTSLWGIESQRGLTMAAATFDTAARSYLKQLFFSDVAEDTSKKGDLLSCIQFDGKDAVRNFRTIQSKDGSRSFSVEGEGNARLVPKHGDHVAELIPLETVNVLAGPTLVCGVSDLDYLVVWTQLRDVSNPLVYPVIWYKLDGLNYARIDQPLQPRNFGRELSTRITKIGTDIAALLNSRKSHDLGARGQATSLGRRHDHS